MDSDSEVEDLMSNIDPYESDFLSSGDEYMPEEESDGSDSDEPLMVKKRKMRKCNGSMGKNKESSDSEDDIPLAEIREGIRKQKEEAALGEDDILASFLGAPMWVRMPISPIDDKFYGPVESQPTELKSPYQYFTELITETMLDEMERETNMYALMKSGIELKTTRKEIETFIGLYLKMGLMKAHCLRAYWAQKTRYPPVADFMTRNRFLLLARSLHFCDNNKPQANDRIWKVRPWTEALRSRLANLCPLENQSVDEVMIAFKGHSSVKQYIRNKPHKWGIKLWARAGSDGMLHDFEIYQGSSTTAKSDLGACGDVVMRMVSKLESDKNYKIFADNLFSSLQLVKALKEKGLLFTGTVRENRLKGCKFKSEKEMKKTRGSSDSLLEVDSNVVAVRWYDNKKVDVISSFIGTDPVTEVARYDRKQKATIQVPCPAIIKTYNQFMGGVDLLDSLTALYKPKIKTRRWYLYIFYHTLNMITVCHMLGVHHMKLSEFQSDLAETLVKIGKMTGRPSPSSPPVPAPQTGKEATSYPPTMDVRLDLYAHLPAYGKRQWCKHPKCNQKTLIFCKKCSAHLCLNQTRNCSDSYHTKKVL